MKILRIFPSQTNATPTDNLALNRPPDLFTYDFLKKNNPDEIHISCTFSWDKRKADYLYDAWNNYGITTKIGGVAYGDKGGEFEAGLYLKKGYIITSRGCINKCWFCDVWKREGTIRELDIKEGFNILDSNILACSDTHIKKVFKMLSKQKEKPRFTGGLEAHILKEWHVSEIEKLKPNVMWFAYDTPDDLEPLIEASKLLKKYNIINYKKHIACCYVLIGYPKDTYEKAEERLVTATKLGFFPQAMLYKDKNNKPILGKWRAYNRTWANKWIVGTKFRQINKGKI